MKKLLLILLLSIQPIFSIEIQCIDEEKGVNITAVTSDETGITYLVFDDGENLLNYMGLNPELIVHTETSLTYKDESINLTMLLDEVGEIRSLDSELLLDRTNRVLSASKCKFLK
ncbi:hypothetical protein A9Q84_04985 [Halobacteriovorax marinus]|uniref:Uncharacterized protein n=1 Tax=Halobacteriovorax marinus TaxID=97084 RepID=A0A1Y5FAP9_9BACT|nr:hypothetical protein A9Q84_04985 [Halobacteriovorax marinus]